MSTIDGIRLVSDDELAAVVGGRMNNGQGAWGDILKGAEIVGAAALVTAAALFGGG
jgi:hypothetical protein